MNEFLARTIAFLAEYGACIDDDRLTDWVELFVEDAQYEIIPKDNYLRHLPIGLLFLENKAMLRDRVTALRHANEYNIHTDRHMISLPRILEQTAQGGLIEANFLVLQTDQGGNSRLFSSGFYRDRLVYDGEVLRLQEKRVVVDTFCVPGMLSTPL